MKPKFRSARLSSLSTVIFAGVLAATSAQAVSLYWDSNGTGTAGAGTTPTGTWGSSIFWSTDSTGANVGTPVLTATTTSADDVFFSAGTDAVNAYTVGLNATTQNARLVTFEDGTVTLSNTGTLSLGAGGGITVATSSVTGATVSTGLTITGGQTFNVAAARTLTLDTGTFTRTAGATLNILNTGTITSTMTGLTANVNNIVGPWASFDTGASTTYAAFSGTTIGGLTYAASPVGGQGTSVATTAGVVTGAGNLNYSLSVSAGGSLGASASINTLRYTGGTGTLATSTLFTTKGIMNVGGGTLTFSGAVTSGASATELVVNAANGNVTFLGAVTGALVTTGPGTVTLSAVSNSLGSWTANSGILVLNGTVNNLPGGTVNSGATARFGSNNFVSDSAVITVNAGGILDLVGFGDTIGSLNGAGSVTSTAGAALTMNAATGTFSGAISGGMLLNKGGAGTYTLSGANTYTGLTTISAGNLTLSNALALQNSALVTTGAASSVTLSGFTNPTFGGLSGATGNLATIISNYSTVTAITLNPQGAQSNTYGGIIANGSGAMTLTKTGTGTQTLSNLSTNYTGLTTISNGTLALAMGGTSAFASAVNVNAGTTLRFTPTANSGINNIGAISLLGTMTYNPAGNFFQVLGTTASAGAVTVSGGSSIIDVSSTGVSSAGLFLDAGLKGSSALTVSAGTLGGLVLRTVSSTYSGAMTVNGTPDTALGTGSGLVLGPVGNNMSSASLTINGTLELGNNAASMGWASNAVSGTSVGIDALNGTGVVVANMAAAASTRNLSVGNNNGTGSFSGVIANGTNNVLSFTKAGNGTQTLSGANTYTGATTVNAGTLNLTGNRTAAAGAIAVTGGTLGISNGAFSLGTNSFLVGTTGANGTVHHTAGSITLATGGNQLLMGNGSGTGIYNLSGGTLTTGAGGLAVTIGVNTGSTGNFFNLSGTGTLAMAATSTLQITRSDNNPASGVTGTFAQTGGTATVGVLQMGGSSTNVANNANNNATLSLTGGTFSAVTFNQLSGGTGSTSAITIGGTAQVTLPKFLGTRTGTATILFDSSVGGYLRPTFTDATYMAAGTYTSAKLTANGAKFDTNTFDITIGQVLQDNTSGGTLTKLGAGTLTLSSANTYTGLTTVTGGALNIGSAGSLNSGNALTLDAGGTAAFANAGQTLGAVSNANTTANALNFSNVGGTVTLANLTGAGNTRFGSNGTVTGGISAGTVNAIGLLTSAISGGTVNAGTLTGAVSGGTVTVTGLATGTISGSGTLGAGSLSSTSVTGGTNTITGVAGITTLNGGTTTVGGVATIGTMSSGTANLNGATSAITTLNGGTINLGSSTVLSVSNGSTSGSIAGTGGSLTKTSPGTLELTGTHTYTGATTVENGTLLINGSISTSLLTTVKTGATLGGSGSVGALTIDAGGFFSPGNSPGIVTVNGNYIQNGTLNAEVTGLTPGITGHDQVNVSGTLDLNGALSLTFNTFTPVNGNLIFILLNDNADAITGTFTGLAQNDVAISYGGFDWQISYTANNTGVGTGTFTGGNDIALMAVPEPGAALLGAIGLLALLRRRR